MSTYRECVYMVLDQLKLSSDDAYFTQDHVVFLLDKVRAYILKKEYSNIKKSVAEGNYQVLCLDLMPVEAVPGLACETGMVLRSTKKIPKLLGVGLPLVYPESFVSTTHISYVSMHELRTAGVNKWTRNFIRMAMGPEGYLWGKGGNPQFLYLRKIRFAAIFENPKDAYDLSCDGEPCDILDSDYPLEESFVNLAIQTVVQQLARPTLLPEDPANNANDDLGSLTAAAAARTNQPARQEVSQEQQEE